MAQVSRQYDVRRSARYIGTLFPVLSSEAAEVATKILDDYWGKPLAVALWSAQRDVYRSDLRRPYVVPASFRNGFGLTLPTILNGLNGASLTPLPAIGRRLHERSHQATRSVSRRSRTSSRFTNLNTSISRIWAWSVLFRQRCRGICKTIRDRADRSRGPRGGLDDRVLAAQGTGACCCGRARHSRAVAAGTVPKGGKDYRYSHPPKPKLDARTATWFRRHNLLAG